MDNKEIAKRELAYYLEQQALFNAGIIKPRKIVGGGYKNSAIARKLAVKFLEDVIAEYRAKVEA